MAALSVIGYPLATTQADLTPGQRKFLLYAIPEFYRRQSESNVGGKDDKPKGKLDGGLKSKVNERRGIK